MKYYSVLILLFISSLVFSSDNTVNLKLGKGVGASTSSDLYSLEIQDRFLYFLTHKVEGGYFSNSPTMFSGYSLGVFLQQDNFFIEGMSGVILMSKTDELLGGYFQFSHDACVGYRNNSDFSIGVGYKHISSAGLTTPNLGRDYLFLRIGLPLFDL